MKTSAQVFTLLICMHLLAAPVFAQATEFSRGQSTVTVGTNTITADNNVTYVTYTPDETIPVVLDFSATCNIAFSGLTLRMPNSFTPKGVTGTISSVTGSPLDPGTSGNVTFNIVFDTLKKAGKSKEFGMAHLNLVLGVDDDCDDDIDGSVAIGVQIKVSTANHP